MLRPAERRWTKVELDARIAAGPPFSFEPPTPERLDVLVAGYTAITGDPVRRTGKRNLVATCYRIHGPDTLAVIAECYRDTGTATNLLGIVRSMPRPASAAHTRAADPPPAPPIPAAASTRWTPAVSREGQPARRPLDCGCPVERLIPGLIYCAGHRPPFDGTDDRRHDRRASNPEAARFFPSSTAVPATGRGHLDETPW